MEKTRTVSVRTVMRTMLELQRNDEWVPLHLVAHAVGATDHETYSACDDAAANKLMERSGPAPHPPLAEGAERPPHKPSFGIPPIRNIKICSLKLTIEGRVKAETYGLQKAAKVDPTVVSNEEMILAAIAMLMGSKIEHALASNVVRNLTDLPHNDFYVALRRLQHRQVLCEGADALIMVAPKAVNEVAAILPTLRRRPLNRKDQLRLEYMEARYGREIQIASIQPQLYGGLRGFPSPDTTESDDTLAIPIPPKKTRWNWWGIIWKTITALLTVGGIVAAVMKEVVLAWLKSKPWFPH